MVVVMSTDQSFVKPLWLLDSLVYNIIIHLLLTVTDSLITLNFFDDDHRIVETGWTK